MQAIISDPKNIGYLTGYFPGDIEREAFALMTINGEIILALPEMLKTQAESVLKNHVILEIISRKKNFTNLLANYTSDNSTIFYDSSDIKVLELKNFQKKLKQRNHKLIFRQDLKHELMQKRMTKTPQELKNITRASEISWKSYEIWKNQLQPGISERKAAWKLKMIMIDQGAQDIAFEPIVAFNKNSALPHHSPGLSKLSNSSVVLVDWGVKYNNYNSDFTRTFWFDKSLNSKDRQDFTKKLKLIKNTYKNVINSIEIGKTWKNLTEVASKSLGDQYKYMIHALGHGIGLDVHEKLPKIITNSVFAIEPAVYYEGHYGIRYENTLYVNSFGEVVSLDFES